ncbi:MAG TPA: OmpA family protein [Novosphingobium sp.]|nr:OmpA family protein [Novosphingobium sp.]
MKMKLLLATGALLASTAFAGSAAAQTANPGEQTSEDLICQLSGDCGGFDQLEATEDKPESRGFKIARKTSAADPSAPSKAVTQRSRTKVTAEASRPAITAAKPGRNRTIAAKTRVAAPGRADMRITFVTGSAELTPAGQREAMKFVTALGSPSLAGKKFRIEGHTDSVGTRSSNLELSQRRAQAVVDYLAAHGADRTRFDVQGYGFDKPLAGTDASAGANRRVEVVLVK